MLRARTTAAPATKMEPQFLEAPPVGTGVGSEVGVWPCLLAFGCGEVA